MGLFSYNCRACGHPLLRAAVTDKLNSWMRYGIIIFPNGDIVSGEYDGYGRIGGYSSADGQFDLSDGSVYHKHCHEALGKPMKFAGRSAHSDDQGHFFNDGDHAMASPLDDESVRKSLAPVGEVKVTEIDKKRRAERRKQSELDAKEIGILGAECPKCDFNTAFVVEKAGVLKVRCPNRECNNLYDIDAAKQAELRKLFAEYPDCIGVWDDDEVNVEMDGVRRAKAEIKQHTEKLADYRSKKESEKDKDRRDYLAEEICYHESELMKAKALLIEEEKKLPR